MNRLAWAILAGCLVLGAAQTIQLSQIASLPYAGVMVNTGTGWAQAKLDPSIQILAGNPPTIKAVGGGAGTQGPPGPPGPQGLQGVQGVQGIQGPPGPAGSGTNLPIIALPDGTIQVKGITTGDPGQPTMWQVVQADGTPCRINFAQGKMLQICP